MIDLQMPNRETTSASQSGPGESVTALVADILSRWQDTLPLRLQDGYDAMLLRAEMRDFREAARRLAERWDSDALALRLQLLDQERRHE